MIKQDFKIKKKDLIQHIFIFLTHSDMLNNITNVSKIFRKAVLNLLSEKQLININKFKIVKKDPTKYVEVLKKLNLQNISLESISDMKIFTDAIDYILESSKYLKTFNIYNNIFKQNSFLFQPGTRNNPFISNINLGDSIDYTLFEKISLIIKQNTRINIIFIFHLFS